MNKILNIFNKDADKRFDLKLPFKKASLDARKARAGYAFVAPFLIGIFLIYIPILVDSIWFSFSEIKLNAASATITLNPVGFDNYVMAFKNASFIKNLLAALQELVFQVPAIIVFSLFIAVVLNQKMLGRAMFRAIFFMPVIIATGVMARIIANAEEFSKGAEIDDGSGQASASDLISALDVEALFSKMKVGTEIVGYVVQLVNDVYTIVNYSGVQMLIFLAGLQSISPSIYEACRIDGASGWETFWKVTFPMISPMILVNAIYTIIDSFTRPTNPVMKYITTEAPQNTLRDTVPLAMSWIYFVIVILIIAVVAAIASSFVFYQRKD